MGSLGRAGIAGLFIGNHGRVFGMSDRTRRHLDTFWELVDEVLNALLFVMIGLELLVLDIEPVYLLVGADLAVRDPSAFGTIVDVARQATASA